MSWSWAMCGGVRNVVVVGNVWWSEKCILVMGNVWWSEKCVVVVGNVWWSEKCVVGNVWWSEKCILVVGNVWCENVSWEISDGVKMCSLAISDGV
ncbi:hypothetical protein AVEN_163175-1 [Araneus ventricosus]|uniref:Uncharacterized protein n=1 Tax=Araneus ventricosus TaxID=182803 RepID=A0A4Y2TE99_ARAVE|nr:hypothetical protein AVEN_163175-1 [Araneus ventricosus]